MNIYISTVDCLMPVSVISTVNAHYAENSACMMWLIKISEYFQLHSKEMFTPKANSGREKKFKFI